jgi:hypothetical protein
MPLAGKRLGVTVSGVDEFLRATVCNIEIAGWPWWCYVPLFLVIIGTVLHWLEVLD